MFGFRRIFNLLSESELRQSRNLIFAMIVMAIFDLAGVALIFPFISMVADQHYINDNYILNNIFTFFKFDNHTSFSIAVGIVVFFILTFSLAFKTYINYLIIRFTQMREYSIGKRIFASFLSRSYLWFLSQNTSKLSKTILSEVGLVVGTNLVPLLNLFVHSLTTIAITIMLLYVDFFLTIFIILVLGSSYLLIYSYLRGFLKDFGEDRLLSNELRYKYISESLNAIREIKLNHLEFLHLRNYSAAAKKYALSNTYFNVFTTLPRYLMEAVAFGGLIIVILYLMAFHDSFIEVIPILSLFAFSAYKILPSIQQIYSCISQLKFSEPALNELENELTGLKQSMFDHEQRRINRINFSSSIDLKNISLSLSNKRSTLKNINMSIRKGSSVAFVGPSGCGKSSLANIIIGLLKPNNGHIQIDGEYLNETNMRNWQSGIGLVPQDIYLFDGSIEENITYGCSLEEINYDTLRRVLSIAELDEFINDLPEGVKTIIGDRGARISGGQIQRIGIARALYKNPQFIVFDEATSALDNYTEKKIIDNLHKNFSSVTVIMIAHRLNTIKQCDEIFFFNKGSIKSYGKYDDLYNKDPEFKVLVESEFDNE